MKEDEILYVPDPIEYDEYVEDIDSVVGLCDEGSAEKSVVMSFSSSPFEEPTAFAAVFLHPYPRVKLENTVGDGVMARFTEHFVGVVSCPTVLEQLRFVMDEAEKRLSV